MNTILKLGPNSVVSQPGDPLLSPNGNVSVAANNDGTATIAKKSGLSASHTPTGASVLFENTATELAAGVTDGIRFKFTIDGTTYDCTAPFWYSSDGFSDYGPISGGPSTWTDERVEVDGAGVSAFYGNSTFAPWTTIDPGGENTKTVATTSQLLDLIYPVGSIYMSVNAVSPHDFLGGTWEQISDTFLLAASAIGAASPSYAAGSTGGEAEHILTPGETATKNHSHTMDHGHGMTQPAFTVPAHSHAISSTSGRRAIGYNYGTVLTGVGTIRPSVVSTGTNYVARVSKEGTDYSGFAETGEKAATAATRSTNAAVTAHSGSTGGLTEANGSAHNNMPPYLAVYIWKRTA